MKNLALALATTLLLAACSSGSTIAPLDATLNGIYTGTFENTAGTQGGTASFNLSEVADTDTITGTAIFDTTTENTCLDNGVITTGTNNGTSATIAVQSTTFQFAISNDGATLSGTYVTTESEECSNGSGAGTITVNLS